MSHPDDETLVQIALEPDQASPDVDHVRACVTCSNVVAEIRGTRDELRRSGPETWEQPVPGLWGRIQRTVEESAHEAALVEGARSDPAATERAELERALATPSRQPEPRARRRPTGAAWLVAAVAVGVIVGLAAAWSFWRSPSTPTTIARTQLDTLDTRQLRGSAELEGSGQRLDLRVDAATLDAAGGYLEVWLINTDGKRMISVGILREPGSDTFPVSQTIISQGYVIVDISREPFDDAPQHSGDSLARGRLPA